MIKKVRCSIAAVLVCLLSIAHADNHGVSAVSVQVVNDKNVAPLSFELTQSGDYVAQKFANEEAGTFYAVFFSAPETGMLELAVSPKNTPQNKCTFRADLVKGGINFKTRTSGNAHCDLFLYGHNYLLVVDFPQS